MKIVGRTDDGYLAQVRIDELALIMGFGHSAFYGKTAEPFKMALGISREGETVRTGTEIEIRTGFDYLRTLTENQAKARACAATLRQIADMITTGLPEVVVQDPAAAKPAS
jgi:hypothetical protein